MKRYKLMYLVLLIVCLLMGCAKPVIDVKESKDTNEVGYPIIVTDQIGREVILEKEPQTIVSSYYISTSLLIALDQEDKLVGVENDADKRPVYEYAAPCILDLPSLGTVKEFDLEECAVLNPDLVIVPTKLESMIPSLEDLGMTVIVVNPESEELLKEMIQLLGVATASEETADELCLYMDDKLTEIQELLKSADSPTVYLAGNSSILSTAGPLMYQNSLIENAGGTNVALKLTDNYWAEVSYEQILAWNPEYIILAADANYTVEDVLNDKNLTSCTAIQKKQVYQIPNVTEPLDSPVPGSLLGTLYVANVLHPDIYTAEQYEETFAEFYEMFYQFSLEEK